MTADFDTGQRFGAYMLGKLLGRGGMGVVYQAQHVHLGRTVALKLLAPELSENEDFRARFLRESRLAATIEHPAIVTIYDAGEVNGVLYLAMRYVRGTDLAALLAQRGPLATPETLSILDQVASALDAAHAAGLVHRDVKPANVMIEGERCYLTDFGLTKQTSETRALTAAGQFLGTVDYVAPEQIEGRDVDGRADVYALGCVLFECLTGSRPFPRDSQVAVLYAQLREPPPRPTELRPDLPSAFDAVVGRAMAKAAEDRYPTCEALVRAAVDASPGSPDAVARTATAPRRTVPSPPEPPSPVAGLPTAPFPPPSPPSGAGLPTSPLPVSSTGLPTAPLPREPVAPPPASPRRGNPLIPLAVFVVLAAAAVAAVLVVSGGDSKKTAASTPTPTKPPNQPTANGPHVIGTPIRLGVRPAGLVFRDGYLWVADNVTGTVTRLKPDGSARREIRVGSAPFDLASNSGSVWAANSGSNTITRIDTSTLTASPQFPVRGHPLFLSAEDNAVWVANSGDDSVSAIDPSTGAPIGSPIPVGKDPRGITADRRGAWVTNRDSGTVSRVENGRLIRTIPVGRHPVGVIFRDGVVWVANEGSDTVTRIATDTNRVTTTKVGRGPSGAGYVQGYIWVMNRIDGTVMRLDPITGRRVGGTVSVPGEPVSMANENGHVVIAAQSARTITRIQP